MKMCVEVEFKVGVYNVFRRPLYATQSVMQLLLLLPYGKTILMPQNFN